MVRSYHLPESDEQMTAVFQDLEDNRNAKNGSRIGNERDLNVLFESLRNREPFTLWLSGDNGFSLTIGWSSSLGFVQYARSDGRPPYWVAVGDRDADPEEHVDFLSGGTRTPIPRRFCMPVDSAMGIARHFLQTGERSPNVEWEEV
jgi:hypothetical protein